MRRGLSLASVVLVLGGLAVGRATAEDAPRPSPQPVPGAPPAPPAPAPGTELPRQTIDLGGGVTFEMVLVPAGEFNMGSPETEQGRDEDETLHRVRITRPYWLATTEVTQAVWEAVMGANPSSAKGPTFPVTNVSWNDCQAFLAQLNGRAPGGGFRLPTEAEWEYACRAGTTTRYWSGDTEADLARVGWYAENSDGRTHAVGEKPASPWGLYDMHGNVWEWCQDVYEGHPSGAVTDPTGAAGSGARVFRGGCWFSSARGARSADRFGVGPSNFNVLLGLRLARAVTVDTPPPQVPGAASPAQPPPTPKPPSEIRPPDQPKPLATPAKEGEVPSWAKIAPEQIEAAKNAGVPVAFENSIGMRFVLIPAGTFEMGSHAGEIGRRITETLHEVTLTHPYFLCVTEVTNRQYRRWRSGHRSESFRLWTSAVDLDGDEQPVVSVSWEDAVGFAAWMCGQDRERVYRLPTEAEWERACRAGTTTSRYWGDSMVPTVEHENVRTRKTAAALGYRPEDRHVGPPSVMLRFDDRTSLLYEGRHPLPGEDGFVGTAPVGRFPPNPWGLHDMLGNAAEWCSDWFRPFDDDAETDPAGPPPSGGHVVRRGSFQGDAASTRSASRGGDLDRANSLTGFRLAVSVPPKAEPIPPRPTRDDVQDLQEIRAWRALLRIQQVMIDRRDNDPSDEQLGQRLLDFMRENDGTGAAMEVATSSAAPYPKLRALMEKAKAAQK